jgi:hypothetical protein
VRQPLYWLLTTCGSPKCTSIKQATRSSLIRHPHCSRCRCGRSHWDVPPTRGASDAPSSPADAARQLPRGVQRRCTSSVPMSTCHVATRPHHQPPFAEHHWDTCCLAPASLPPANKSTACHSHLHTAAHHLPLANAGGTSSSHLPAHHTQPRTAHAAPRGQRATCNARGLRADAQRISMRSPSPPARSHATTTPKGP